MRKHTSDIIVVRSLRRADAAAVVQLMQKLAQHHGDTSTAMAQDFIQHCFGTQRLCLCWVAQNGQGIIGFVLIYDRFDFVRAGMVRTIDLLYVDSESRHKGAGRALLAMVAADAVRKKIRRIIIGAAMDNTSTHRFYEKLGMVGEDKIARRYIITDQSIAGLMQGVE